MINRCQWQGLTRSDLIMLYMYTGLVAMSMVWSFELQVPKFNTGGAKSSVWQLRLWEFATRGRPHPNIWGSPRFFHGDWKADNSDMNRLALSQTQTALKHIGLLRNSPAEKREIWWWGIKTNSKETMFKVLIRDLLPKPGIKRYTPAACFTGDRRCLHVEIWIYIHLTLR